MRSSEVARGVRSEWHRSAKALTPSSLLSSSRTLSGEYSSSGIIRSCRYLIRTLSDPQSPSRNITLLMFRLFNRARLLHLHLIIILY